MPVCVGASECSEIRYSSDEAWRMGREEDGMDTKTTKYRRK